MRDLVMNFLSSLENEYLDYFHDYRSKGVSEIRYLIEKKSLSNPNKEDRKWDIVIKEWSFCVWGVCRNYSVISYIADIDGLEWGHKSGKPRIFGCSLSNLPNDGNNFHLYLAFGFQHFWMDCLSRQL